MGRWLVALVLVALAAAAIVGVRLAAGGAAAEPDGSAALGTGDAPGSSVAYGVDPRRTDATSWTFGLPLCLRGAGPVTLRSVTPTRTVGSGFRFLGARVRRFTPGPAHEVLGSVTGFPPPAGTVPDPLSPVAGFVVRDACPPAAAGGPYTELLLGFGAAGPGGGGWDGLTVGYEQAGGSRSVAIAWTFEICGSDAPAACHEEPAPSSVPSSALVR